MLIKSIKVSNFKSFYELDVQLGRFNVVIGANATGKSNFIDIFRFLKDIVNNGLDNAFSMQGGIEYTRNLNVGASRDLSIEIRLSSLTTDKIGFPVRSKGKKREWVNLKINELDYQFHIGFYKRKKGYRVKEEKLEAFCELTELERKNGKFDAGRKLMDSNITLTRNSRGRLGYSYTPDPIPLNIESMLSPLGLILSPLGVTEGIFVKDKGKPTRQLFFLGTPFLSPMCLMLNAPLAELSIFDFDPRLLKKATLITGKTELEPDGSNLAIVLKNVGDSTDDRKRFSQLIGELLPFIEDVSVQKLADKSLIACLKESYCGKRFLPASVISDGTVNLTALVIALYFEQRPFIVIEEPERNIHPYLISKVINMMKDVSERLGKQVIATTHNPEVVKYAGVDNILLVYRDGNFSKMTRPSEREQVKHFLKNEMGVDELFVKGLLK